MSVFMKFPEPGAVKTRLARSLGEKAAAGLYRAMLEDQLEWVSRFPSRGRRVYFSPSDRGSDCQSLAPTRTALRRLDFCPQASGDLGRRLDQAFQETLQVFPASIIIGSDAPLLGPSLLQEAFSSLQEREVVLGPACDGGYYLIGLRRPSPKLFVGVPWSTSKVLDITVKKAKQGKLSIFFLCPLRDIDTISDLEAVTEELKALRGVPGSDPFPARTFGAISELNCRGRLHPGRET